MYIDRCCHLPPNPDQPSCDVSLVLSSRGIFFTLMTAAKDQYGRYHSFGIYSVISADVGSPRDKTQPSTVTLTQMTIFQPAATLHTALVWPRCPNLTLLSWSHICPHIDEVEMIYGSNLT